MGTKIFFYIEKLFMVDFLQVINAYIHLLRTQDNMINRPGGTCYLENTSMTVLMKGDGEEKRNMEDMEDHYPSRGHSQVPRLAERVLSYMQHDMVTTIFNITIYTSFIQYTFLD